jgi:hypothetical protein
MSARNLHNPMLDETCNFRSQIDILHVPCHLLEDLLDNSTSCNVVGHDNVSEEVSDSFFRTEDGGRDSISRSSGI